MHPSHASLDIQGSEHAAICISTEETSPRNSQIAPGTPVVINGLSKSPAFNGLSAVVQSWDDETGRYNVLLASPSAGRNWAKVKGENLHMATPPTPQNFAEVQSEFEQPVYIADLPPSPTWEDTCVQLFPR